MIENEVRRHSIESGIGERHRRHGAVNDRKARMFSSRHGTHRRLWLASRGVPAFICKQRGKSAGARADIQQSTTPRLTEQVDDDVMSAGTQ